MSKNVILVGDKFATFAQQENVTTPLAFCAALEDGKIDACNLILGQGVSDAWVAHITDLAAQTNAKVTLVNSVSAKRASSKSCHKVKRQNALISEPQVLRNNAFGARLLIDEDCELMGDHQTGHHLQGMLLVEAARQMFLAVIERYLRPQQSNYAVINHLNSTFQSFAFPLSTDIELTVETRDEDRPDRGSYDVQVVFLQNGSPVTTIDTRFTVFDAQRLAPKEAAMAQARTQDCIAMADKDLAVAV